MTYAEQARARGWVRRTLGPVSSWWNPAKGPVYVVADTSGAADWWDPKTDDFVAADSEEDALRLALAAWPAGGGS